jgi:aspartyl protease family protein
MDFSNFSSADWQNFSYSALLIVVLTAGLITRKEVATSKILKYLAIWSGVVIVLIALYSYRYEFSDFKNRLFAEINPANPQATKSGEIVINISQDGHFYVNAKINGQEIRFMVDTGASDIAINMNDARKIGLSTKSLIFNKRYQTANGISWGAGVILEEVEIANVKFSNIAASVGNNNMGVSLLGMSFLKQLKKYEFYQDKLVLTIS